MVQALWKNLWILVLLFLEIISCVQAVRRNTEQLNVGFIFSLPYDISNTLRAPLAGPLSLILAAGLAMIMLLGLLASPLYYLFGFPERNYFIHDAYKDPIFNSWFMARGLEENSEYLADISTKIKENWGENMGNDDPVRPTFLDSVFLLFPEISDQCKYLMVCHAHGFMRLVPIKLVNLYQYFSKKLIGIPEDLRIAILIGLENQGDCSKVFNNCTQDITTISRNTFAHLLSNLVEIDDL